MCLIKLRPKWICDTEQSHEYFLQKVLLMIKSSYLISGLIFLGVALWGSWFRRWGHEEFAFLLLTYLIVIIGIRLDELTEKISALQDQLTQIQNRHFRQ